VYDLPLDYYGTLPQSIQAVTAGEVHRVANQYLQPDRIVVVAVGDRSRIEPELKALDLGTVESRAMQD